MFKKKEYNILMERMGQMGRKCSRKLFTKHVG